MFLSNRSAYDSPSPADQAAWREFALNLINELMTRLAPGHQPWTHETLPRRLPQAILDLHSRIWRNMALRRGRGAIVDPNPDTFILKGWHEQYLDFVRHIVAPLEWEIIDLNAPSE